MAQPCKKSQGQIAHSMSLAGYGCAVNHNLCAELWFTLYPSQYRCLLVCMVCLRNQWQHRKVGIHVLEQYASTEYYRCHPGNVRFHTKRLQTNIIITVFTQPLQAVTTAVALEFGLGSSLFAVALCFTVITMYDAAGVRRHAGLP